MTAQKILIFDDDPDFRQAASEALKERGFDVCAPRIQPKDIQAAFKEQPSDLLMDVNLGRWSITTWLKRLHKEYGPELTNMRIWLVSGSGDMDTESLRKEFDTIQTIWFGKPLDIKDIVTALMTSGKSAVFRIPENLAALPLPLRVIEPNGSVVYTNRHWRNAGNRPNPQEFLPFSQEKVPEPREFWGVLPLPGGQRRYGDYRLHSFTLMGGKYLAQMAETLQNRDYVAGIKELVQRAFEAMKEAGFSRGRFYRIVAIPGCAGKFELAYQQGGIKEGIELPVSRVLDGVMMKRLQEFRGDKKPDERLVYAIRSAKGDKAERDLGIDYWNDITQSSGLESWLEVPVLTKYAENDYRPAALFRFERRGASRLMDGNRDAVEESQVQMIVQTLRHILSTATRVLSLEEREKERQRCQTLTALDEKLFREVDRNILENTLLRTAIDIAGASGGFLITLEGASEALSVRTALGYPQKYMKDARFNLDTDFHPIVSCWSSTKPVFIPCYPKSTWREKILEKEKLTENLQNGSEKIRDWFAKGIGSLIAMPIRSGNRVVGAVSLQSPDEYAFDENQVHALEGLLQRVRWFLQVVTLTDEQRRMWEYAFVHEIRSNLVPISHGIDMALRYPDEVQEELSEMQIHIQRLQDISQNFMDVQMAREADLRMSFDMPGHTLADFLELYGPDIKRLEQEIKVQPDLMQAIWSHPLRGSREVFARVVRNIFDNALKFGGQGADIHVNAAIIESMWQLSVSNPGWMTAEENELKFTAHKKPRNIRHDGSHVGLAASQSGVRAYGGELTLDNEEIDGQQRVRALLRWPMAKKQEKGVI